MTTRRWTDAELDAMLSDALSDEEDMRPAAVLRKLLVRLSFLEHEVEDLRRQKGALWAICMVVGVLAVLGWLR